MLEKKPYRNLRYPVKNRPTFLHLFTLIWLLGVIFLDKTFAYLSFGSIYITEFLLVLLIISEWKNLRTSDVFFIGVVCTYIAVGALLGRDIFFVIKDMSWLYYLLFLRFFPKDFPSKYIDIVVWACVVRLGIIFMYPVLLNPGSSGGSVFDVLTSKYRDGVVIMFLLCYATLKSERKIPSIQTLVFLSIASFLTIYKTLILAVLAYRFFLTFGETVSRFYSMRRMLIVGAVLTIIIYTKQAETLLFAGVDALNVISYLTGIGEHFSTGTATWRAEIWTRALWKLVTPVDMLFGEFPGHNFIDSKFLGIKSFPLAGGDRLGNLRSAHNILVQMLMKTGVVGVILFCWYYFKQAKTTLLPLRISQLMVLVLALTADILEVPSRGPLAFCLFMILRMRFETNSKAEVVAQSKLHDHADADGRRNIDWTEIPARATSRGVIKY